MSALHIIVLVLCAICGWLSTASLIKAQNLAKSERVRDAAIYVELFAAMWWFIVAAFVAIGVTV